MKTVPVMDELATVIALDEAHSSAVLGVARSKKAKKAKAAADVDTFVLIAAGLKGVLRMYKIEILVTLHYRI